MSDNLISSKELRSLHTEGNRATEDLAKMAEMLGYKGRLNQFQCKNGSFISSFLYFLEDNPGAVEAIHDWVKDNYCHEEDEEEEEEEEG